MGVITIRGIDKEMAKLLKKKAVQETNSVNTTLLKIIKESLGLQKRKKTVYTDLDQLAGTWSKKEYAEFQKKINDFEIVDEKMWR